MEEVLPHETCRQNSENHFNHIQTDSSIQGTALSFCQQMLTTRLSLMSFVAYSAIKCCLSWKMKLSKVCLEIKPLGGCFECQHPTAKTASSNLTTSKQQSGVHREMCKSKSLFLTSASILFLSFPFMLFPNCPVAVSRELSYLKNHLFSHLICKGIQSWLLWLQSFP